MRARQLCGMHKMRRRELYTLLFAAAFAATGCGAKHVVRASPPSVSTPPPQEESLPVPEPPAPQTGAPPDLAPTLSPGPRGGEVQHDLKYYNGRKKLAGRGGQAAQCRSERPHREDQRFSRPGPRSDCRRRLGSRAESGGQGASAFQRAREIAVVHPSGALPLPTFADKILM